MASPQALLVDLDGTLVDSVRELAIAVNQVRRAFALAEASLPSVRDWVGEGVTTLLRRSLAETAVDAAALTRARRIFDTAYEQVIGTQSTVYPGVTAGLARLRAAGFPLACVTNKPEHFARKLLQRLDILQPFAVLVGGDTTTARKPDPLPLRVAADRLGVDLDQCLAVGDSEIDVATARNAGCSVWCVRTGYARGADVDHLGADAVFEGFDQVAAAVLADMASR